MPIRSATVLVALAETAGRPTKISAGKVSKVPPPASAFITPATAPAAISSAASEKKVIQRVYGQEDTGCSFPRADAGIREPLGEWISGNRRAGRPDRESAGWRRRARTPARCES